MTDSHITLRLATANDDPSIRHLAELDTTPPPLAPALVATEDGRMLAALSLIDGHAVADPFKSSAAAIDLLRVRAAHLEHEPPARRSLRRLLAPFRRPAAGGAALAGSPPGAGGRLLDLSTEHRALTHPR